MPRTDIDIKGMEGLRDRLKNLEKELDDKGMSKILKKGSTLLAKEMRKKARSAFISRSGTLVKSIADQAQRTNKQRQVGRVVGPRTKGKLAAPHAHLVELGTKAGVRRAKGRGRFSVPIGFGQRRFVKEINRRSTKTQNRRPFIEPTYNTYGREAQRRIETAIDKLVQK